jgi:hypothetical protein
MREKKPSIAKIPSFSRLLSPVTESSPGYLAFDPTPVCYADSPVTTFWVCRDVAVQRLYRV